MQLFRPHTPYRSLQLLRPLSSSSKSLVRSNPSEHRRFSLSESSYGNSGGRVGSNSSHSSSSPMGRLDISDETTYMPQKPAGNSGVTIKKEWGFFNKNGKRISETQHIIEQRGLTPQHGPKSESLSVWARIAVLAGVGTTMLESDIRRLVPGKTHIPEFKTEFDILRVSPYRFPRSLLRRPFYSLIFASAEAAKNFVYAQGDFWLSNINSTIPPGQVPRLYLPTENSKRIYYSNRLLTAILNRGGCSPGACVLLVVSDIGGMTTETGKLPRTAEIRKMLEDADVHFCKGDELENGVGLERILFEKSLEDGTKVVDKFDGSERGAEAKWIVRCRDAAEAHRVVREWHRKEFREGGGKFSTEIIY